MKLYQPSNGTEGFWFEGVYCEKCIHWPKDENAKNQCWVYGREIAGISTGKWIERNHIPTCTRFKNREEFNKNRKRYKKEDPNQLTLFKE